jgi:hypothetical protein
VSEFLNKLLEIPENRYGLTRGSLLLVPEDGPIDEVSAWEFMRILGGDENTYILLAGVNPENDILYGVPLGKDKLQQPPFIPSWSINQLCEEIDGGIWQVAHAQHPEYSGEVNRRLQLSVKH